MREGNGWRIGYCESVASRFARSLRLEGLNVGDYAIGDRDEGGGDAEQSGVGFPLFQGLPTGVDDGREGNPVEPAARGIDGKRTRSRWGEVRKKKGEGEEGGREGEEGVQAKT